MTKKEMSAEIVRLVCKEGKGLSIEDASQAIQDAQLLFWKNAKVVDGMLAE